ncbi:MAG: divergent polysaccharide deacetylase family protein [Kordiimonadaceae bacterium]|nr:divergent polysaccharide deacetylase family protein [Kordiimonadaceae bacterium]
MCKPVDSWVRLDNAFFRRIVNGGLVLTPKNRKFDVSLLNKLAEKSVVLCERLIKRAKAVDYKRLALGLYGAVIALVLLSMVYLLNTDSPEPYERYDELHIQVQPSQGQHLQAQPSQIQPTQIQVEGIEGIIAAVEGQASVAIENIDEILPIEPDIPVWQQHAANWVKDEGVRIAIVIDDVGLSYDVSMSMTEMKGPLTLSFLPYADMLPQQTQALKGAGHELMVHLPMEPKLTSADPGPNALLSDLSVDEFERRVVWNLTRFDDFVGINNHMGSLLTENPALMVRVMVHLRREGYLFLDSLTSPNSVAARAARATGVPNVLRDIFLDNDRSVPAILRQLGRTEEIAKARGYAVAIGHPYPETLKALEFWTANLKAKGIALVPLSQIIAERESRKLAAAQAQN